MCVEGVETEEELRLVSRTGCDFIQGFYLYYPKELPELESILAVRQEARREREEPSDR